jgi:hypothetical protein
VLAGAIKPHQMTNTEIRAWYQREVSIIESLNQAWVGQGLSLRERARRAWRIRHDARLRARSMMEAQDEVEQLRTRDRAIYGNPDGPTFERLFTDHRKNGATPIEAYERMIRGAQMTNKEVDQRFRKKRPGS